ncbi:PKD domain-containing protein [Arsukibacterium indicum]|uniref:Ig-like domain-containing protein n=1 Tax=Arsukibacterium indicum TaxID=2848612 RepID=A0ABS6MQH0_9GAMM|nr:hypothetical protein [Arsukibacterium indicum]MBV2131064.1 hypothetical protein [Arsukibacterium indicum]
MYQLPLQQSNTCTVRRFDKLLIISCFILSLFACGDSDEPEMPTPPPVNTVPVVDAGSDMQVYSGEVVFLNGTATDAEGSVVVEWQQISGPEVELVNSNATSSSFTAPDVTELQTLVFELTATDSEGLTATDRVQVTVEPAEDIDFGEQSRLINIYYDFDNNGVFEGQLNLQYDVQNRYQTGTYTYTDDGTTDTNFESFSLGSFITGDESVGHQETFTVDDQHRVTEYVIISSNDTTTAITVGFDGDFTLNHSDLRFTDNNFTPVIDLTLATTFTYSDGRLFAWEQRNTTDGSLQNRVEFEYMPDGKLETKTDLSGTVTQFFWLNNKIEKVVDTASDGSALGSTTYVFEDQLLVREEHEIIPLPGRTFTRYDFIYEYDEQARIVRQLVDLGANGNIEAVVRFEYEQASCSQPILWLNNLIDPLLAFEEEQPLLVPGIGWGFPRSCHIVQ